MTTAAIEFGLGLLVAWLTPKSPSYRPDTWPPSRDWPVSVDKSGRVLSRWGDAIWDLTPFAGRKFKLNFGDGPPCQAGPLDPENADLLRLAMTWLIWGPKGSSSVGNIQQKFTIVRAIFSLCHKHNISASSLVRFPRVLEEVPKVVAPSRYENTIAVLHRLYDAREALGFTILDESGLRRLATAAPEHEKVQTPYIPPRIWVYQITRLRECLDDFLLHSKQVEACFDYCLQAYVHNFGTLEAALVAGKDAERGPFNRNCRMHEGCTYHGKFIDIAARFGIAELLERWGRPEGESTPISIFSGYMTLVTFAAAAYIANFTLQRKEEVGALRSSCLIWEHDEQLGKVSIVCGETTKTMQDSDARWVASPSVEVAIKAQLVIARLRMQCDRANAAVQPSPADQLDPYLFSSPNEPWSSGEVKPYDIRSKVPSLQEVIARNPQLFDCSQLKITPEDMKIARHLTPNLPVDTFAVGLVWPLAWHQYRRTTAVNMFASGLISDSTMQLQMKHSSRLMPLYYGRGHSRLHLNAKVEAIIISAMYSAMAERLRSAVSDAFVSPAAGQQRASDVVTIISESDTSKLIAWAKAGKVSFRETRLGGCLKIGPCEYGGIESVARCAGGDGHKPCSEARFDRRKEPEVRANLGKIQEEVPLYPEGSPKHRALSAERLGLENFLDVIANF